MVDRWFFVRKRERKIVVVSLFLFFCEKYITYITIYMFDLILMFSDVLVVKRNEGGEFESGEVEKMRRLGPFGKMKRY